MEIRPWRTGDDLLAAAAGQRFSITSLSNRFLVGTGGHLPAGYLRHIAAGPRATWDAQVAVDGGDLIGWAEFGRMPNVRADADLAVIVTDAWHRHGVATALINELIPRAAAAGVRDLYADLLPTNDAARALLASIFGPSMRVEYDSGLLRYHAVIPAPTCDIPMPISASAPQLAAMVG